MLPLRRALAIRQQSCASFVSIFSRGIVPTDSEKRNFTTAVKELRGVLTEAQVEEYQTQGAVCIRGLLSPGEIDTLKEAIEYNISNPSLLAGTETLLNMRVYVCVCVCVCVS
jgi:hypothetical protein